MIFVGAGRYEHRPLRGNASCRKTKTPPCSSHKGAAKQRGTTLLRRILTNAALRSADTPLRCYGRTRSGLRKFVRPDGSGAIFSHPHRVRFHLTGLSYGGLTMGYSPFHSLIYAVPGYSIAGNPFCQCFVGFFFILCYPV